MLKKLRSRFGFATRIGRLEKAMGQVLPAVIRFGGRIQEIEKRVNVLWMERKRETPAGQ